jgi:hypothetical protein
MSYCRVDSCSVRMKFRNSQASGRECGDKARPKEGTQSATDVKTFVEEDKVLEIVRSGSESDCILVASSSAMQSDESLNL